MLGGKVKEKLKAVSVADYLSILMATFAIVLSSLALWQSSSFDVPTKQGVAETQQMLAGYIDRQAIIDAEQTSKMNRMLELMDSSGDALTKGNTRNLRFIRESQAFARGLDKRVTVLEKTSAEHDKKITIFENQIRNQPKPAPVKPNKRGSPGK